MRLLKDIWNCSFSKGDSKDIIFLRFASRVAIICLALFAIEVIASVIFLIIWVSKEIGRYGY